MRKVFSPSQPLRPSPCKTFADQLILAVSEQSELVEQYERRGIEPFGADAQRIRTLTVQIADLQSRLAACLLANPPPPPPPPIATTFVAAGVLIIENENTPDPISTGELFLQLSFAGPAGSPTGRGVVLTGFPPITQSFDTPLGLNTMTITRQSGGSGAFVGSSGQLVLDLVLAFESSLPSISKVTLPLHFTSGAVTSLVDQSGLTGSPMNAVGQVRLVATSVFVDEPGGLFSLDGSPCSFVLDGVVSPHP